MNIPTAGIAGAIVAASAAFTSAAILVIVASPGSAIAQEAGFTAIGSHAEYRIDGVRDGVHNGANVRFIDMTVRRLAAEITFVNSIQEVWWQGRTWGAEVLPIRRDGRPFGMYDQYVRQGQVVAVSYPVPVRDDVTGVTVEYAEPGAGPAERFFSWDELRAARR